MIEPTPEGPSPAPIPKLDYASATPGKIVRLASYGTTDDAELHAAELAAEGIPVQVINGNINSLGIPYTGLADVELHVHAEDATRAAEVLARETNQDLEPVEEGPDAAAPVDENGQALQLVPAGAYDNVRQLREAQTVLASARVRAFLPTLAPRADRAAGVGKRFVLRVCEEDLGRAIALLQEADESGAEEPRCPKCGSWRVYPVGHFWKDLASLVGLSDKPQAQVECLACRYRGPAAEFAPGPSK